MVLPVRSPALHHVPPGGGQWRGRELARRVRADVWTVWSARAVRTALSEYAGSPHRQPKIRKATSETSANGGFTMSAARSPDVIALQRVLG